MAWNKRLSQLNDALSTMVPFANQTLPFLTKADISIAFIDFGGNSLAMWNSILRYADSNNQVAQLVDAMLETFPKNPYLLSYKDSAVVLQDYTPGPNIKSIDWKTDLDEKSFEKITSEFSTLLPINFLSKGLVKARSVARVCIPQGSWNELGSGFLLKENWFVTNNHVIKDRQSAERGKVQFNFEESDNGNVIEATEYTFDAKENHFFTDPDRDCTIVKLNGNPNEKFEWLTLMPVEVKKNDFVNIIQHPGGRYKQIALYHNMVMYADAKVVQYLTDTEPGSSGSPVFNSNWQVVALHNSGGTLLEPGTQQQFLRNQGININQVIDFMKEKGIY